MAWRWFSSNEWPAASPQMSLLDWLAALLGWDDPLRPLGLVGNLVHERTRCVHWMQQALDQMNVQVHRAVSDLTGQTGMAIVRAIVGGERDPLQLAALRGKRCHKSEEQFARYLTGNWRAEHLFNLGQALQLYDMFEQQIATYEQRLLEEVRALTPPERNALPLPKHPSRPRKRPSTGVARDNCAAICGASRRPT